MKRLPPYGRLARKSKSGARRVACGPEAWSFARHHLDRAGIPPMVLPARESPSDFVWPVKAKMLLIIPCGDFSDVERAALVGALLRDGAYACLFTDTYDWCGKLPADSHYWINKKPAARPGAAG